MNKLVLVVNCKPHKLDNLEFHIIGSVMDVTEDESLDHWKILEECKYKGRLLLKENCLPLPDGYLEDGVANFRLLHVSVKNLMNVVLNLIVLKEPFDMQKATVISQMLIESNAGIKQAILDYHKVKGE